MQGTFGPVTCVALCIDAARCAATIVRTAPVANMAIRIITSILSGRMKVAWFVYRNLKGRRRVGIRKSKRLTKYGRRMSSFLSTTSAHGANQAKTITAKPLYVVEIEQFFGGCRWFAEL